MVTGGLLPPPPCDIFAATAAAAPAPARPTMSQRVAKLPFRFADAEGAGDNTACFSETVRDWPPCRNCPTLLSSARTPTLPTRQETRNEPSCARVIRKVAGGSRTEDTT